MRLPSAKGVPCHLPFKHTHKNDLTINILTVPYNLPGMDLCGISEPNQNPINRSALTPIAAIFKTNHPKKNTVVILI